MLYKKVPRVNIALVPRLSTNLSDQIVLHSIMHQTNNFTSRGMIGFLLQAVWITKLAIF